MGRISASTTTLSRVILATVRVRGAWDRMAGQLCRAGSGVVGIHVLFEATWIRRPAAAGAGSAATLDWRGVQTPTDLEPWSERRRLDVFFPDLLDSDNVRFNGAGSVDGAGFALNRSGGVVGVSNVFAGSADLITLWSDLVVVAARTYPGFDLVGYELGADLQAALAVGFAGIGQLRVWMR
jgi:hypothetical protein